MDNIKNFLDQFGEFPIIAPLIALLKSRKAMVALATLLADTLIAQHPEFVEVREALMLVITALGGMLIYAIAGEDAALKGAGVAVPLPAQDTPYGIPGLGPILVLLNSRKFLIATVTLIVDIVIAQHPEFVEVREALLAVFTVVGGVLIHAIMKEDAAEKSAGIINPAALASFKIGDSPKASG